VLRRSRGLVQPAQIIRAGEVVIDLDRHEAAVAGNPIELTPIEFDLLVTFARHPGHVFTRLKLLEQIEDTAYAGFERTVDQHIKNLRVKLDDDARRPRYIATVRGVGYKFIAEEAPDA
jgi:DNA-binding response OmpR family regulator